MSLFISCINLACLINAAVEGIAPLSSNRLSVWSEIIPGAVVVNKAASNSSFARLNRSSLVASSSSAVSSLSTPWLFDQVNLAQVDEGNLYERFVTLWEHVNEEARLLEEHSGAASSAIDRDYPVMEEFAKAGVTGGISEDHSVVRTISPEDDLQVAVREANEVGGGVVLLTSGTYEINEPVQLEDNVVIKGEDRDAVTVKSSIRATWEDGKKNTFVFERDRNAGIENLSIEYHVPDVEPIDRRRLRSGSWCEECFTNNPGGREDLYVRQIYIAANSSQNWVRNVSILSSGTDPIVVAGDHNTLTNNLIDRAYNKGPKGNAYYAIHGDYNLITGETVKRIRHFALQQGAEYNVVTNSKFEVDINFHNGDDGNNLIESNVITIPDWHSWDSFTTGGEEFGHKAPGEKNILVSNTVKNHKTNRSPFSAEDVIYTFVGYGKPIETNWEMPVGGEFYTE